MTKMEDNPPAGRPGGLAYRNACRRRPQPAMRETPPWDGGPDAGALLNALRRAFEAALGAGKPEAAARIVAEAARLKKERPAAPAGPHPWERFRSKFT